MRTTRRTILFVSALDLWSLGRGKGGPSLWRTLTGYAERGWEVFFLTGNRSQGAAPDLPENIHVIRFDAPWLKWLTQIRKLGFFFKVVWWLWFQCVSFIKAQKLHAEHEIHVVYGYEIYGVPVTRGLSRLWRIPVVSRFQGSILRLVWMRKPFWILRAWEHVVAFKLAAKSDLVIMTNDGSQGDRLLAQMGVKQSNTRFWLNGIDKERFSVPLQQCRAKQELGIQQEHVFLCVSRLMALKRVDRCIQALSEAADDSSDMVLVIVGDGPERGQLEKLACALGVDCHVRFEGAVDHADVPKYLAAADVFLSFYDWSNVGNPLLEAMIAGKCIVTLNNGDTSQFITDKENGILLEYDELTKLPEVIRELLADEGERRRLGANARRFAEDNFWTWEDRIDAEVNEVTILAERRGEPTH